MKHSLTEELNGRGAAEELPSVGILRLIISGWSYMIMYNLSIIKIMLNKT